MTSHRISQLLDKLNDKQRGKNLQNECFLSLVATKLNISNAYLSSTKFTVSTYVISEMYAKQITDTLSTLHLTSPYGMYTEEVYFATVVEPESKNTFATLSKPLDSSTWICLLLSIGLFVLFVRHVSQNTIGLPILFNIIDQGQRLRTNTAFSAPLFLCVTMITLIVSNSYKGKLFELSLYSTYPAVPKYLHEISSFDYQATTFSTHFSTGSKFVVSINEEISNLLQDNDNGKVQLFGLDSYRALSSKLRLAKPFFLDWE